MAAGRRVSVSVVSRALPGDGSDLPTVLEFFRDRGRRTGLVTTSYLLDATPAAFGAHAHGRSDFGGIAAHYLRTNGPSLLLGGGFGLTVDACAAAGFTVVGDRDALAVAATSGVPRLAGLFGDSSMPYETDGLGAFPHLREMTDDALRFLGRDDAPFFLMAEGGKIDPACHANSLRYCLAEMLEFERAVDAAVAWAGDRNDVLILVVADHETGGLEVTADRGPGEEPSVVWHDTYHTTAPIPLYARGAGAARALWASHLIDMHSLMTDPSFPPPTVRSLQIPSPVSPLTLSWVAVSGRVYRVESAATPGAEAWDDEGSVTAAADAILSRPLPPPLRTPVFYRVSGAP
jgi:alkaline phosphatase